MFLAALQQGPVASSAGLALVGDLILTIRYQPEISGSLVFGIFRRLLSLFLFTLCFAMASPVFAAPSSAPITESGFTDILLDDSGLLTINEVSSPRYADAFRPLSKEDFNPGYTKSTFWFRITPPEGEWLLEVTYPHLDSVNLYVPRADGGFRVSSAGDKLPFAARELSYHNPLFKMMQHGQREYFLEIRASGSAQVYFRLWNLEEFEGYKVQHRFIIGLFFGGMSVMALYNFFLFFATRDRAYLYYITYICAYLLFQSSMSGFSYQYLWPESPFWTNKAIPLLLGVAVASAIQFSRHFLQTWVTLPLFDKAMKGVMVAGLLCAPLVFVIPYIQAAIFANIVAFALVLVVVPAAYVMLFKKYKAARFFVVAWTTFLIGIFAYALMLAGIFPQNVFTVHAMPTGSFVEVILLSFALADRINALRQEKQLQQVEFNTKLQQLNQELESKVIQRTQELELAKVEMEMVNLELARKNMKLEEMASHDVLTGLLNRRSFWEQAEFMLADGKRNDYPLSVVMLDLDNFKQINDQYGHQTGDEVLCAISRILVELSRMSDRAARYGGDEFVLLLPHTDQEAARQRAERLIATIDAKDFGAPTEPALSASVGIASTVEDGWDLDELVRIADQRLYKAKSRNGN